MCCEIANKMSYIKTSIQFVKEGNVSKTLYRNSHKPTLLDGCRNWRVIADVHRQLAFPTEIISTRQHPDLDIWSVNSKKVIIAELTIPLEANIDWAHQQKLENTKTCMNNVLRMAGQQTYFLLRLDVEVISNSTLHF